MENERFYRGVFYAGCVWNFLVSLPVMLLVQALPSMLKIEPPRFPIFIYFNLMTVFMFGCVQFVIARNLQTARPYVKILFWSKIFTVLVFIAGLAFLTMPPSLSGFLAPGMVVDFLFALLFWRYLVFSGGGPSREKP